MQKIFPPITGFIHPLITAGGLLWLCVQTLTAQASPDSARITLTLPNLTFPADAETMVVPVGLRNEWNEVGGLQLDLFLGDRLPGRDVLNLDTVLTTGRTPGWQIDLLGLPREGASRLLLFDPAGSNIAPGAGPVMELVFVIPESGIVPDLVPLKVAAVSISDPVGSALEARGEDGSLTLGEVVEISVGSVQADQGETATLAIDLSSAGLVVVVRFSIRWEPDLLELVDIVTTSRTDRFQLEWKSADSLSASAGVLLYAQAGKELEPGAGEILAVSFAVPVGLYHTDIEVYLEDARAVVLGGREQAVSRIMPGRVTVFPGRLDPPRSLVALSGQDGRVPLSWAPPVDGGSGAESLLLVDDDASQLGPPYLDAAGQMATDLAIAGYAFDYFAVPIGADGPGLDMLRQVHTVIWLTGYEWGYHPTLTPDDQANLAAFLKGGGRVWLVGQDIIRDIGDGYIRRHFGVRAVVEDAGTPEILTGSVGGIMEGTEYRATASFSEADYGDAITTATRQARGVVAGPTHFGAVGQDRTAFWALEYGYIFDRIDRIDGIHRQLAAFGVEPSQKPGIGRVLTHEHPAVYASRASSPVKADIIGPGQKETPTADSLTLIPAPLVIGRALPVTGYAVYRSDELPVHPAPENRLATLGPADPAFVDTAVVNGQTYGYAVAAIYEERFESDLSNEVTATPIGWVDFTVGQTSVPAGGQAAVPIRIRNDEPVAGVRFKIRDLPTGLLTIDRVVLGDHAPPDWVVSLDRDTLSGGWSVVAFSPRLTTVPPGGGEVLLLMMTADALFPTKVSLEVSEVVISDAHGDAYNTRVTGGAVSIDVQLAQLRLGTGAPTQPGDTGYVTIFLDNPQPVIAFQLIVTATSDVLRVVDVSGTSRLPADAHVAHTSLGRGAVRLIESSFSNTSIAAGRGPVVTVAYQVSPDTPEGLVGLALEKIVLSGESGITLRYTVVSGSFPVGEVRAVFAPAACEGEPGRTVTVPMGLTNSVDLCGFQMTVGFDPRFLTLLSSEPLERLPDPERLSIEPLDSPGEGSLRDEKVLIRYAPSEGEPIQAGTGPVLNLVYLLERQAPRDTSLTITISRVSARGCRERLVFSMGQEGKITIGQPSLEPVHFSLDVVPTGVTHFIQVHAATLGGMYLDAGDELAVIDSSGWINPEGRVGGLVVGAGVVQPGGSVKITAVMGFVPGPETAVLPGARAGGAIFFQAWDREMGREGRPSTNARYVLGEGLWGENSGLTIVEVVRIPEEVVPAPVSLPDQLEVEPNEPNPFQTSTTIRFGLPGEMEVRVTIYDLMGREVVTLHDGLTAAGFHEVVWDGSDPSGSRVANGMYFYQVRTPDRTVTRKLLFMR